MPCNCGKNKQLIQNQIRSAQQSAVNTASRVSSAVANAARSLNTSARPGRPSRAASDQRPSQTQNRVRVRASRNKG